MLAPLRSYGIKGGWRAWHTSFKQALPGVGEHPFRRANEVRAPRLLSSQPDDDGRGIRQHDRAVMADQPARGGRCKRKRLNRLNTRPKKRSILVRLPSSSAVQVGGKRERLCCRLGFQGTTATAPKTV